MEILAGVAPTTHSLQHAPATAGELLAQADDIGHVPEIVEVQAAAETARLRRTELVELTLQLSDLSTELADAFADVAQLLQDPTANANELLARQARIDTLQGRIDELQARIDLAVLRADQADLALLQATAGAEAALAKLDVTPESHRDLFLRMADALDRIQTGFVRETQDPAQEFIAFFRSWADVDNMLNNAIKADTAKDREGYVIVTFNAMRDALSQFIATWEGKSLGTFTSRADAERFLRDTGLIEMDFPIRESQGAIGAWEIGFPVHIARAQRDSMPAERNPAISWNNAEYQAWLNGKNNRQESLQNNSRVLVERLNRVNQIYDNLVQVWSEAQRAIHDADRQFAQSL